MDMDKTVFNNITFKQISLWMTGIYITTIFIFNYSADLNIISQIVFVLAFFSFLISLIVEARQSKALHIYIYSSSVAILSFSSIIWSIDQSYALKQNITFVQLIILMLLIYNVIDDEKDLKFILNSIFIGGMIMSIYSVIHYGPSEIVNSLLLGKRLGGDINQENAFGYYSNLTFFIGLYKGIVEKSRRHLIYILLPLTFIFSSGSRKAVFILLVSLPFFILLVSKKNWGIKFIIVLLISFIFIYSIKDFEVLSPFFGRINNLFKGFLGKKNLDGSTLTRIEMIKFGWNKFLDKPLFGYGTNQYNVLYLHQFGISRPSHNNFINIMVSFGVIGFVVYYTIYIYFIFSFMKLFNAYKINISIILLVLLLMVLINDFSQNSFNFKMNYISIALFFSFSNIVKSELNI